MERAASFLSSAAGKKWFPQDKNYVLKEAQQDLQEELLAWTCRYAREFYQRQFNPLGLVDDTIRQLQAPGCQAVGHLRPFYEKIAAIYRYRHGEVQLELLFDGRSHSEKYRQEWQQTYRNWLGELYLKRLTLRAVLELTVFGATSPRQVKLINQRLQQYLEQHFGLRLYVYKGITRAGRAA